jgi:heme-degrading monooxygenase HmoA
VLQLPGCKGIYYLNGKETNKALSITLWDTEEGMVATRQDATKIREETSEADNTQIVSVEEFEVTVNSLNN